MIGEGVWDLAAFSIEQYCQLFLKYKLLVKTATYPRTHSIIRLLRYLAEVAPEVSVLLEDPNKAILLTNVEDAYIGARYLPRRYEEVEVKGMLRFAKEVFREVVEGI